MDSSVTYEQLLMRRSDVLIADGQYEDAISCLDEILKEHPDDEHALSMKGLAYCLMGDSEKGIECLEEALEIDPFSKEVLIIFADACLRSSMPEKSLGILDRAISFYPDDDGLVMLKEVIIMVRDKNRSNLCFN
ncbi:tetratricopeptide repeat protein [Methanolobus mangrovi]|uniref:Tetratricopeptide repeat protein n=1 Tax=Methanolobus mangrovi TaxID=3072977 RepID=A0AA51UGQ6_9EURY|nr:tetratricopeptide repeat protein [Methanolobus mangrovi]WMW22903.1 tetratricopeptide repeat protein [Methanolobus mangrovi]